jgi:DNA-binding transcriptional LysR family regulator
MKIPIENISWDDLRFFLHVGRGGSLSAAAQSMSVSHATAFRRLQRLERDIGVQLFSKTRSGYKLTEAGDDLMGVIADLDFEVQTAMRRLNSRDAWPGGVVRVTTTDTLMHQILPPILTSFQRSSGVQLHINTSTALLDIIKGEADVAIRAGGRPPEPLVGRRVCRIESTVYYSKKMRDVTIKNLGVVPWVAGDDSFAHLDSSKWLRAQGLESATVIRTSSYVNLFNLIKNGAGLGVLSCYMGDLEPSLCRLMPPPKEWRSDLWLLTRAELRNVPRIKRLFDAIYDGTRSMVPLFEGQAPISANS